MATKQKRYVKVKVRVGNKFLVKWKDTKTGKTYWNKPTFDHTRQSKPGLGVPTDEKTTERQKKGWKGSKEFNKSQSGGELGVGKALTQVKETKPPTKDEGYGAHVRGQQKKDAPKDTVKTTPSDTSETKPENKEKLSNQVDAPSSKNKNRLRLGSLKLGGGLSERQIDSQIRNLKRKNKASNRMKIKRLEALKKKKKK